MMDISFYLVSADIARRSGLIESRYVAANGKYILDNKDLSRIRLTSDEFINGLQGIEKISKGEAQILIKQNGYKMGNGTTTTPTEANEQANEAIVEEESPVEEIVEEQDDNNNEE